MWRGAGRYAQSERQSSPDDQAGDAVSSGVRANRLRHRPVDRQGRSQGRHQGRSGYRRGTQGDKVTKHTLLSPLEGKAIGKHG